jgi:hypothetical protein
MTAAGQAFLFAGELFCLSFAAIPLVYFADRLRCSLLGEPLNEPYRGGDRAAGR